MWKPYPVETCRCRPNSILGLRRAIVAHALRLALPKHQTKEEGGPNTTESDDGPLAMRRHEENSTDKRCEIHQVCSPSLPGGGQTPTPAIPGGAHGKPIACAFIVRLLLILLTAYRNSARAFTVANGGFWPKADSLQGPLSTRTTPCSQFRNQP